MLRALLRSGKPTLVPFSKVAEAASASNWRFTWALRFEFVGETTVILLSPAALASETFRRDLLPKFFWLQSDTETISYHIIRGMSPAEARRTYPETVPIFERTMVVGEDSLDELFREFPRTVDRLKQGRGLRIWRETLFVLSSFLAIPIWLAYVYVSLSYSALSFAIPVLLFVLICFGQYSRWMASFFWLSGLLAMLGIYKIHAFDFWRWGLTRWQISRQDISAALSDTTALTILLPPLWPVLIAWMTFQHAPWTPLKVVEMSCVALVALLQLGFDRLRGQTRRLLFNTHSSAKPEPPPDSQVVSDSCDGMPITLLDVFQDWKALFLSSAYSRLINTAILIGPALYWSNHGQLRPLRWWLVGFVMGIIVLHLFVWSCSITSRAMGRIGLLSSGAVQSRFKDLLTRPSRPQIAAFAKIVGRDKRLSHFSEQEQTQVTVWLEWLRTRIKASRPSAPTRTGVFVSYAWEDDEDLHLVAGVKKACDVSGLDCYADRWSVPNPYGIWRPLAGQALASCSHFFLVVGPRMVDGAVVWMEIEAAVGRWIDQDTPAIVCIADEAVAAKMRSDSSVPLILRFLLTFCPRISYADARSAEVIRRVVAYTRCGGVFGDWSLIFLPTTRITKLLRPSVTLTPLPGPTICEVSSPRFYN